jgi:hypothetical protein
MYQTTIYYNDDSDLTLQETIEEFESFGLTLVSKEFSLMWDEWTLIIQGSVEQFFAWNDHLMEGGPAWNEDEFMDDLVKVEAA